MLRRLLRRPHQHDDFGQPSEVSGLPRSAGVAAAVPVPSVPPDNYDGDAPRADVSACLLHRPRQHDDFGPPSEITGLSLNADAAAAVPVLSDSAHYDDDDDYDVDVPILRHVLRHNLTISQDNFYYTA